MKVTEFIEDSNIDWEVKDPAQSAKIHALLDQAIKLTDELKERNDQKSRNLPKDPSSSF